RRPVRAAVLRIGRARPGRRAARPRTRLHLPVRGARPAVDAAGRGRRRRRRPGRAGTVRGPAGGAARGVHRDAAGPVRGCGRRRPVTERVYSQPGAGARFDWGLAGAAELGRVCAALVVVDTLSFSTSVTIAVSRGIRVHPFPWGEQAEAYAVRVGATVAAG